MGAGGLLLAPFFFADDGGALVRTAHWNHWPGSRGMCTRNATIARVIRALNIRMVSEIVQGLAGGWSRQEAEEFRAGMQFCGQIDEDWRK